MSTLTLDPYTLIFGFCGALTLGSYWATQRKSTPNPTTTGTPGPEQSSSPPQQQQNDTHRTPEFVSFQRNWLIVYLLAMFSDWLQGPYAYALYSSLGFTPSEIAILSLVGFGSSMLFGTFVGAISDTIGRKKLTIVFAVLYIASALTKLSPDYWILCFGRVLSGIATSLLFSVFESWMVCAHNKRGFAPELISDTFTKATSGNGFCAIIAGLVADQMSGYWGLASPFVFACVPLVILLVLIQLYWDENTGADSKRTGEEGGESSSSSSPAQSKMTEILNIFRGSPHIMALGLAQSLFEGAMYTFVFLWSLTLSNVTTVPDGKLPYGRIFATFMVVISLGSTFFGYLTINYSVLIVPFIIHIFAAASMVLAGLLASTNEYLVLLFFLLFEMTCGMFWPAYGTLRSTHIPEAQRATVSSVFRIPLNLFVVILLSQTDKMSTQTMFVICALAHIGSLCCYTIFYREVRRQESIKATKAD